MTASESTVIRWRKSSWSANGQNCVEVAAVADGAQSDHVVYLVRDSKAPDGPQLHFSPSEWEAFLGGVKAGEFDPHSLGN
ncbi:DUF397 domain-containing protein [Sinosporangium siamense]|uniref:DUF397 domain-containing protein n=1 Tax=Sinosporangium siamense TaxID=1367973 RepID=A0A919V4U5_9ACTN|nr:DUF397 domain-containing protein [Sinosporangium siamense]GII92295.1 DUF397 domain-containing protein [Sinosporangium siamense]